jgi:hypothetical protein
MEPIDNNAEDSKAARREAYEARQEARRDRFAALAVKHAIAAADSMNAYHRIADMIPLGQPILVGHHSERKHRRAIARMDANIAASVNHDKAAAHYADRAENYGKHGISSDDPDAVDKLAEKLAGMERDRDDMKRINAHYRKHQTLDGCPGLEADDIERMKRDMARDWRTNPKPFETFQFSNVSANIRRVKDRIKELQTAEAAADVEKKFDAYTYREDAAENRVMFFFPGKPDDATRAQLKRNAFKWSPSRGAWVRQLNNAGKYAAKVVMKAIDAAG